MSLEAFVAGGVLGYLVKPKAVGKAEYILVAPGFAGQVVEALKAQKPALYESIFYDAAGARTNEEKTIAGDYILVEESRGPVDFYLRLNEPTNPALNLTQTRSITGPFYRFFITNVAGNGHLKLWVCRGMRLELMPQGIEELANRIIYDTPMSYDRRGEIVWADNFEDNIAKWNYSWTGAGGSAALSSEAAQSGGKSAKLVTGTTAGGANPLGRYFPTPIKSKIGAEVCFSLGSNIRYFQFAIQPQLEGKSYAAIVRYLPQDNLLQYYDENLTWQTLSIIDLFEHVTIFNNLKLVIDLGTSRYVRCMLNGQSFDISHAKIYTAAGSDAMWPVYIQIAPDDAANRVVYIDNFILTQNEP